MVLGAAVSVVNKAEEDGVVHDPDTDPENLPPSDVPHTATRPPIQPN